MKIRVGPMDFQAYNADLEAYMKCLYCGKKINKENRAFLVSKETSIGIFTLAVSEPMCTDCATKAVLKFNEIYEKSLIEGV